MFEAEGNVVGMVRRAVVWVAGTVRGWGQQGGQPWARRAVRSDKVCSCCRSRGGWEQIAPRWGWPRGSIAEITVIAETIGIAGIVRFRCRLRLG
ncbi:hypothetical protein GCM10009700_28640 [Brevibacterium sanguinis]